MEFRGCVPEFGAIFMSNNATKKECLRRKLLGLPSGFANFVKQVKAGMLLFLFEFESRQLHGVFQACSDGAMNIVPHAFSSSGKQFPAQVKFTSLWHCSPLSEKEFRDAIEENYFSASKFNFGLSEDQVRKLLSLFSSRKLSAQPPQKHFTRRDANHKQLNMSSTFRRSNEPQVSNLSCPTSDGDANVINTHAYDPDAPGINYRHSLSSEVNRSFNPVREFASSHSSTAGNIFPSSENQQEFAASHNRCSNVNSGLDYYIPMPIPNHHEASPRTSMPLLGALYSKNTVTNSSNNEDYRSLSLPRPSSSPVPFSGSGYGDRITEEASRRTSMPLLGAGYSRNTVTNSSDNEHYRGLSLPRPSLSPVPFSESGYGDRMTEEASRRISMQFLGAGYSRNTVTNSSDNEHYRGLSLPRPSLSPLPISESGYGNRMIEGPYYPYSPSSYPSFVLDYGNPVASQEKRDHELPQRGTSEGSAEYKSIDHHDNSSLKPHVLRNSESLYSDRPKNKDSVFSRLAFPFGSEVRMEQNGTPVGSDEDTMDVSVGDIMSMLHQSHYQWVKRTKHKLIEDDTSNFRKQRQTTFTSRDHWQKNSKEMTMNDIPASEDNDDQFVEISTFVDFRRRSKVRKTHDDDTETAGCNGSVECEGFRGGVHKRRKLIRPNFSKNVLLDDKNINGDSQKVELSQVPCQISHANKNIEAESVSICGGEEMIGTCRASSRSVNEDGRNESSQDARIRTLPSSVSCEDKSYIAEEGLNIKDPVVGGLSLDLTNSSHSTGKESSHETLKKNTSEITSGKIELYEEVSYPNSDKVYPVDGEIAVNITSNSSNQNPKSERAPEELVANGKEGCTAD